MAENWFAGTEEPNFHRLQDETGAAITTGTAQVYYTRHNGSSTEYLQSDRTTWSTSVNSFTNPYDSLRGFGDFLVPPVSAIGFNVSYQIIHSVYGLIATATFTVDNANPGLDIDAVLVP